MLGITAEELLRTRTVPELREICQRLEVEAAQKQRELQTMVRRPLYFLPCLLTPLRWGPGTATSSSRPTPSSS